MSDHYPPEHRDRLLEFLRARHRRGTRAIEVLADELGCSPATAYRWRNALKQELAKQELARVEPPAASTSVAAQVDREEALRRERRRRELIQVLENDIEHLARDRAPEGHEMALGKLKHLRVIDPKCASTLEARLSEELKSLRPAFVRKMRKMRKF